MGSDSLQKNITSINESQQRKQGSDWKIFDWPNKAYWQRQTGCRKNFWQRNLEIGKDFCGICICHSFHNEIMVSNHASTYKISATGLQDSANYLASRQNRLQKFSQTSMIFRECFRKYNGLGLKKGNLSPNSPEICLIGTLSVNAAQGEQMCCNTGLLVLFMLLCGLCYCLVHQIDSGLWVVLLQSATSLNDMFWITFILGLYTDQSVMLLCLVCVWFAHKSLCMCASFWNIKDWMQKNQQRQGKSCKAWNLILFVWHVIANAFTNIHHFLESVLSYPCFILQNIKYFQTPILTESLGLSHSQEHHSPELHRLLLHSHAPTR